MTGHRERPPLAGSGIFTNPLWLREKPYLILGAAAVLLVGLFALTRSAEGNLAHLFDLNGEANLPTWYTAMLWLVAGLSAYRVSRTDQHPRALYWLLLAIGCALLSVDEVAQLHETIGGILDRRAGDASGVVPVYRWARLAIVIVILAAFLFRGFLLRLERRTALRLVGAGAVFLAGAIGIESLGSLVEFKVIAGFPAGLSWHRSIALEEVLEMIGAVLMLRACDLYSPPAD